MAYTVLARKYRSRTFDEVVGQEAIAQTLKNAIAAGRIHHGYLFTGTRGVGKTSMARIVAKALNCLSHEGPTPEPCCECDACVRIAEGDDVDVIEIDAASHTGVDNIREVISNAQYRPARSRYKVYIIDEVHMLSTGAFNALLKTLEEPPGHVKFILATTEPQKVPATVQSRCQRFDFRAIPPEAIERQLSRIVEAEGVEAEAGVLRRIARLANGSMRDALSLLDQLLAVSGERLSSEVADALLAPPFDEVMADLVDCFIEGAVGRAVELVDAALGRGYTLERFSEGLIQHLRTLMLIRVCGMDSPLVDVPAAVRERVGRQAEGFDAATYAHMIAVVEELRRAVRFSGSGRALTEAVVVRLCELERFTSLEELLGAVEASEGEAVGGRLEQPAKKKITYGDEQGVRAPEVAGEPATRGAVAAEGQALRAKAGAPPAGGGSGVRTGESRPPVAPGRPARAAGVTEERGPGGRRRVDSFALAAEMRRRPAIQKVLEVFEGTLVSVQPAPMAGRIDDAGEMASAGEEDAEEVE